MRAKTGIIMAVLIAVTIGLMTSQVVSAKTVHLKAGEKVVKVKHHHKKHHHAKVVREVVVEKVVKHHKAKHRASSNMDNNNGFNSRDVCNFVDSPRAAFEFGCF